MFFTYKWGRISPERMVPFIGRPSANNHHNPPPQIELCPYEISVKLEPSMPPTHLAQISSPFCHQISPTPLSPPYSPLKKLKMKPWLYVCVLGKGSKINIIFMEFSTDGGYQKYYRCPVILFLQPFHRFDYN